MNEQKDIAVICSTHFNAVGIAMSLREEGWRGRVACLKINATEPELAERWPGLCEIWPVSIREPAELPRAIADRIPPENVAAVFFCDERFHSVLSAGQAASLFPAAQCWLGPRCDMDVVLDRWRFYSYLREKGLAETPETARNPCDPWQRFGDGFRARVWRSWRGMTKLPRGRTIRTHEDFDTWRRLCESQGVAEEEWGCQELLSTDPKHTVSVCGWHDPFGQLYLVTRWVRQQSENGWLVETTEDPAGLCDVTQQILTSMEYHGPFEMEFMQDRRGDNYKVIELNPRFWMQHRLVGSELIRRYLALPPGPPDARRRPRYWLNTDVVLGKLLTLRGFDLFPYLRQGMWSTPLRGSLGPALRGIASSVVRLPLRVVGRVRRTLVESKRAR